MEVRETASEVDEKSGSSDDRRSTTTDSDSEVRGREPEPEVEPRRRGAVASKSRRAKRWWIATHKLAAALIVLVALAAASLLCGVAPNLTFLIVARVLQGIGGGGMAPSEQAMLADTFSPSKRAQAFAAYGVAVIVAPALGPTIGGYLTDNASWHWIFFINVPIGAVSLALVAAFVDEPRALNRQRLAIWRRGLRIDWVGFALVALFLGFLEIVLDKGQEDDWFNSPFITACAVIAGLSFLAFVPCELSRDDPIVDIRLIGRRNFGASFVVMLVVGAVLFGMTQTDAAAPPKGTSAIRRRWPASR